MFEPSRTPPPLRYATEKNVLLKIIAEILYLAIRSFRTTVRISNKETPCTHKASDDQVN